MLRFGVYIGVVENNKDPFKRGRVRVRVSEIFGERGPDSPTNLLPWANVIQLGGGSYDGGSHTPFPIGSTVAVVFEQGNVVHPYVIGGVLKKPVSGYVYGKVGDDLGEWNPVTTDTDAPREAAADDDATVHVVYKSPKGATILIEEADGAEFIKIIDRSGQLIEMFSPVSVANNDGNAQQRGTAEAPGGIGISNVEDAFIRIVDLEGQEIKIDAKNKKITITAQKIENIVTDAGDWIVTVTGRAEINALGDVDLITQGKAEINAQGDVDIIAVGNVNVTGNNINLN